jgi:alkyl sulfatase BDS1-like metallo-beta-lactamase superfamily hydrolase
MHTRKQIIENQKLYRDEIVTWLRDEYKTTLRELRDINATVEEKVKSLTANNSVEDAAILDKLIAITINEEKEKLLKKAENVNFKKELEKFFINDKNIYPKYYAWWDKNNTTVTKYKNLNL